MDPVSSIVKVIDAFLIAPYRWPGNPWVGWWLGTLLLSFYCTLLSQISSALAHRVNRSHVETTNQEMMDRHHQSLNALRSGDKAAYKKINKLANEAYGKSLFLQLAMAGAYLWPVPFALGWLKMRFSDVGFPFLLVGKSVGYPFIFIPLYILTTIIFRRLKNYLLSFGGE